MQIEFSRKNRPSAYARQMARLTTPLAKIYTRDPRNLTVLTLLFISGSCSPFFFLIPIVALSYMRVSIVEFSGTRKSRFRSHTRTNKTLLEWAYIRPGTMRTAGTFGRRRQIVLMRGFRLLLNECLDGSACSFGLCFILGGPT